MTVPTALLVMRRGPGRGSVAAALRAAGLTVRRAGDPFEATGDFARKATDLVVVDIETLGASGHGFVRALRSRSRAVGILLLMGPEERRRALRALAEGADAYVLKPWFAEEVSALAKRLVQRQRPVPPPHLPAGPASPTAPESLRRLADEVAHAVNNPLQVLSLKLEGLEIPPGTRKELQAEIGRIRDVVRGLSSRTTPARPGARSASPRTPPSQQAPVPFGALLVSALETAEAGGRIRPEPRNPDAGPSLPLPEEEVRSALGSLVDVLAARAPQAPARVVGRLRVVRARGTRYVEAVLEAPGVRIAPEEVQVLRETLLRTDDATRRSSPGLALACSLAADLGGSVLARDGPGGTALVLRLPAEPRVSPGLPAGPGHEEDVKGTGRKMPPPPTDPPGHAGYRRNA